MPLLLAAAATSSAHVAGPTPAPNPRVFSDAAMTYTAPANAHAEGAWPASRTTPRQLSQDPLVVAAWTLYPDMDQIKLEMESYDGPPSEWERVFEAQVLAADSADTPFFSYKTQMRLLNGMPATFVEIDTGGRSAASKEFAVLWADGRRGIVLSETMPADGARADRTKRDLGDVTAVAYP